MLRHGDRVWAATWPEEWLHHWMSNNYLPVDPVINQLLRCSDGFLYAVSDQGLFRYEQNRFVPLTLRDGRGQLQNGPIVKAVEVDKRLILLTDPYMGAFPIPASLMLYDLRDHRFTISTTGPVHDR